MFFDEFNTLLNLEKLNISKNNLNKLSFIKKLPNLKILIANDNVLMDIYGLKDHLKLKQLSLKRNCIKNLYNFINVLKTIPKLK